MLDKSKPYVAVTFKDGEQSVEAHNYHGKGCRDAVNEIQKALGGQVTSSFDKPEINLPNPAVAETVKH